MTGVKPTLNGRIKAMMQEGGLTYRQACQRIGSRGGKASAAAKRRRAAERERIAREKLRLEAMGLA